MNFLNSSSVFQSNSCCFSLSSTSTTLSLLNSPFPDTSPFWVSSSSGFSDTTATDEEEEEEEEGSFSCSAAFTKNLGNLLVFWPNGFLEKVAEEGIQLKQGFCLRAREEWENEQEVVKRVAIGGGEI